MPSSETPPAPAPDSPSELREEIDAAAELIAKLPTVSAHPLPELPGRRKRMPRFRLLVVGLVASGIGVGTSWAVGLGKPAPETHAHEPRAHTEPGEHGEPTEPDTVRIDLLIRSGWYDDALKRCRSAPRDLFGPDERPLIYREAVCLEGLGQWKDARIAYRRAAEGEADLATQLWAALGQARCAAVVGDVRTARGLLNRVALQSGAPEYHDKRVLASCLHLRARLGLLEAGYRSFPDPLDADALAWPVLGGGMDYALAWLPTGESSPEPHHAAPAQAQTVAVDQHPWVPGACEITAHVPAAPAARTLNTIGTAAGWKVHIEPEAMSRLEAGTSVAVDVERAPLPEVLAALTEPHGVECRVAAGSLEVRVAGEADAKARRDALGEALWRAVWHAPDHPATKAARVALANLEFEAGHIHAAYDGYQQFLEAAPHASESVCAEYNLGLIDLRQGGLATARGRFLNVIDRSPRSKWEDIGRWWVGRTHLDAGDTPAARKAFEAARGGKGKEVASAAVLGLVACHLLDGDNEAAAALLDKQRPLSRDMYSGTAEWFEAVLRYRLAPSDGRAKVVCEALKAAGDGKAFGPAGMYLAGRVYSEVGRPELMVEAYDAATETARGPFAVRMTFDAAEYYLRTDSRAAARDRFLAVIVADPTGLGPRAELRVAELAIRAGRGAECVRRCRAVLGQAGIDSADVLRVMGRGFELEGRYRLAAECFAGQTPSE